MTETLNNNLINKDYNTAADFYVRQQPLYVGRQVISQQEAQVMPVNLSGVYQGMFETLAKEPTRAMSWARTFGALSICVALDIAPSNFKLDNASGFKPPNVAEVETAVKRPLQESLYAPEQDSPVTFLLAEGEDRIEMTLIKALHMVDFGIVRRLINLEEIETFSPLILTADADQLFKLRKDHQEALLRIYGNVRGAKDAFRVMGTVIPTNLIESSGIQTRNLELISPRATDIQDPVSSLSTRIPVAMAGVTTAKRPHIGHAFLFTKTLAEAGPDKKILVELNDLGPRVARAVEVYAGANKLTFEEAAGLISDGRASIDDVEQAYKSRIDNGVPEDLPTNFSLSANNSYYTDLIGNLMPGQSFVTEANSNLIRNGTTSWLKGVSGTRELFGVAGMSLLSNPETEDAVVTEKRGQLTMAGIVGALSTKYALTLVDSEPAIDRNAQAIFEANDIGVEMRKGLGVSFDFKISSGSNGNALLIDELVSVAESLGYNSRDVLPTCRAMLSNAYFVPGGGGSVNPNFASRQAALEAFISSLPVAKLQQMDQPIEFHKTDKRSVVDMMGKVLGGIELRRKPDVQAVQKILEIFPNAPLGAELVDFVANHPDAPFIPKNVARSSLNAWNKISSQNPQFIFGLLERLAVTDPDKVLEIISGTAVEQMMQGMGYDSSDVGRFFAKLKGVKDVFRIKQ